MRQRRAWLLAVAGAAAVALGWAFLQPMQEAAGPSRDAAVPANRPGDPAGDKRLAALPDRAAIGKPQGEPFATRSWAPAPSKPAPKPQVEAPPAPPALPYRFAGRVVREGVAHALLAKGDVVLAVREGETLEGGYRVESISAEEITLLYLPLGTRQRITVRP